METGVSLSSSSISLSLTDNDSSASRLFCGWNEDELQDKWPHTWSGCWDVGDTPCWVANSLHLPNHYYFFFFKAKNKRLKEKKSEFLKNPNYNDTRILDVIDQLPTHRLLLKGVAFPVNRLA